MVFSSYLLHPYMHNPPYPQGLTKPTAAGAVVKINFRLKNTPGAIICSRGCKVLIQITKISSQITSIGLTGAFLTGVILAQRGVFVKKGVGPRQMK